MRRRHGVLLHVLAHVDADHRPLVVEQELGERAGQLGLADAGGAEEQERADRPVRVGQAGPAAADGVGHRGDGLVLADDPLVQHLLHADELLASRPPSAGDTGTPVHLADDLGDVLLVDLLLQHLLRRPAARRARFGGLVDLPLELGDLAVADLGRLLEVGLALELACAWPRAAP